MAREIKVKELTLENFRPYGTFSKLLHPTARSNGLPGMSFHADMEILELGTAHTAAFSVTRVTSALPHVIVALEHQSHCGEGILPLDGDMLVYFAPAGASYEAALQEVEAFVVPRGVMLTIRPGVWHCCPYPVNTDVINVLNVLPERTYANDCTMKLLAEDERIRIAL